MKRFFDLCALSLLVVGANAHASTAQDESFEDLSGYTHLECEIRPFIRRSDSRGYTGNPENFTHPHLPIREGTSTNWSGYVAATNLNYPAKNSVSAVYGTWIVPTVSPSAHDTYSSLWVGIDGYTSSTVEQIGTEHDWANGRQEDYAWFEMYPAYPYEIVGFTLKPGDVINASVVYKGNNVFLLTLVNKTRKVYSIIPTSYTTLSFSAQRSSAEWIVEAPFLNGTLPLAHLSLVKFSSCTAVINGFPGSINNGRWVDDALIMETENHIPKATPSALTSGGQAFTVAWHHE